MEFEAPLPKKEERSDPDVAEEGVLVGEGGVEEETSLLVESVRGKVPDFLLEAATLMVIMGAP